MGHELHNGDAGLSASNTEGIILYGSAPSPCVRRVVISLVEKGLDFDTVEVDLANMEQRTPAYLALNPNGFVPTLSHGEHVIFESWAINEYLEEQFPDKPLLPSDPYLRAQARMWIAAEGAMAKLFRPLMYQRLQAPILHSSRTAAEAERITRRHTDDPTDIAWEHKIWNMEVLSPTEEQDKADQLMAWLDILENALVDQTFLVGNAFSLADISVYPRVRMYSWAGLTIDPNQYPNVDRWILLLDQHPSFERSLPEAAKKLEKLAKSPLLTKLRNALNKPPESRNLANRSVIWLMGKVIRKIQRVDELLTNNASTRTLPLPRAGAVAVIPRAIEQHNGQSSEKLELFSFSPSPFCNRIEQLVKILGQPYTVTEIDINAGAHESPAFLAMNPQGDLPVLKHGDRTLYNSAVIAEYLVDTFAELQSWMPGDSQSRAELRMWLAHESGSHKELKPLWDRYVAQKHSPAVFTTNEENSLNRIGEKLQRLESTLQQQTFLLGESPSYADLAWHSQLHCLQQMPGFTVNDYPAISRWLQVMTQRPNHTLATAAN
ncbi:MAG: glutathione S-transferase family protein [Halioglobus sp.]